MSAITISEDLLEKAKVATPPSGSNSKWSAIVPAVEILIGRGFNLSRAVKWLIEQGAISPADERKCFVALFQRSKRKNSPPTN